LPKNELFLEEKTFEECRKKRQEKDERLQSIKREIKERSKELGNLKREISYVEIIKEAHKKLYGEIEQREKVFQTKEV